MWGAVRPLTQSCPDGRVAEDIYSFGVPGLSSFPRSVQERIRIEKAEVWLFVISAQTGQGDAVGLLAANQNWNKTKCSIYVITKQGQARQLGITSGFQTRLSEEMLTQKLPHKDMSFGQVLASVGAFSCCERVHSPATYEPTVL